MPNPTDADSNRIRDLVDDLMNFKKPDDRMQSVLMALAPSNTVDVEVGKFYLFIYNAKTPNIVYDSNPFVKVEGKFQWGFRGLNAHWRERRNYTWAEVGLNVWEVNKVEVQDVMRLTLRNEILNN